MIVKRPWILCWRQYKTNNDMKLIPIFFIILFAFLPNPNQSVSAQTVSPSTTISVTPTLSPTPTPIEYQLPYPGLLPDNPLYKFKTLRDRIIFFLISDPIKKAQFDLLQSDKRINAAWYMVQNRSKDSQLIIDTLSKGQNYFSQGLSELSLAKKQGFVTADMLHQFLLSSKKHREILMQIKAEVFKSTDQLKNELQRVDASIRQLTSQGVR